MEVTQEKPNHPDGQGEQEAVTQEPTSVRLLVEATAENQEVVAESQEDVDIGTQEDVATQEPTSSQLVVGVYKKGF